MARYTMDVYFDIPSSVLSQMPKEKPQITCPLEIDRFDRAATPDEYSSCRIYLEGSDRWCQKTAKQMVIAVLTPDGVPHNFKAADYEIVSCQG